MFLFKINESLVNLGGPSSDSSLTVSNVIAENFHQNQTDPRNESVPPTKSQNEIWEQSYIMSKPHLLTTRLKHIRKSIKDSGNPHNLRPKQEKTQ